MLKMKRVKNYLSATNYRWKQFRKNYEVEINYPQLFLCLLILSPIIVIRLFTFPFFVIYTIAEDLFYIVNEKLPKPILVKRRNK